MTESSNRYVETARTIEGARVAQANTGETAWRRWGPYLAERAWGSVRENADPAVDPWQAFPHEHSRSRAYRWNEDGIGGLCDDDQRLCQSIAVWNGKDPILKERLFGLTGPEGNHGEDVKEYYYFLDAVPTSSYLKMLYRYPNVEFPYADLVAENASRGKDSDEYELVDALRHDFAARRYTDITIEYAKATPEDVYCRLTAHNRSDEPTQVHLLPHLWARNTWSWELHGTKPTLTSTGGAGHEVEVVDDVLGQRWWYVDVLDSAGAQDVSEIQLLFTDNESNRERLGWGDNTGPYVKDGIHRHVVNGEIGTTNTQQGTKVAAHWVVTLPPHTSVIMATRLTDQQVTNDNPLGGTEDIFTARISDADEFYRSVGPDSDPDITSIQRQAFAGLIWSFQFYNYDVERWIDGDPAPSSPFVKRDNPKNVDWRHMRSYDVISMPDSWEYPWFAVWDLAFHAVPLALIDSWSAKYQLLLFLKERYVHPNGQIPAYEWNFSDVNPPVHAWAVWRVYQIDARINGTGDTDFLERAFHKLLLNFTWWVNRKDPEDRGVFSGGFLGLDNIGVFDRSKEAPMGGRLEQSDSTAWMAMFCLNMLTMSIELAQTRPAYEDIATKFLEHFVQIANAAYDQGLWDEEDGFFYDVLHLHSDDGSDTPVPLKVRSLVGLIPLFAVDTIDQRRLDALPEFSARLQWFAKLRPHLVARLGFFADTGDTDRRMLSLVTLDSLRTMLTTMLDESEFLSPWGIRSMSKAHQDSPYTVNLGGTDYQVAYEPGESQNYLFGGNSNWRGPIWFPVNFLMIESLQKYHHYLGDDFTVELPTGSGTYRTLNEVAMNLSLRLISLFTDESEDGQRTVFGDEPLFAEPEWNTLVPFYEYFHGDRGRGLGASHQTGWTATVAKLIHQTQRRHSECSSHPTPHDSSAQK